MASGTIATLFATSLFAGEFPLFFEKKNQRNALIAEQFIDVI